MIQLITKNNSQGWFAEYILKRLVDTPVEVVSLERFQLRDTHVYNPEASVIVVVGFPYFKSEQGGVVEALDQYNNPFSSFYHFCSFGDRVDITGIHSLTNEEVSPVKMMFDTMTGMYSERDLLRVQIDPALRAIVDAVDDYHTYSFVTKGNNYAMPLKELGDLFKQELINKFPFGSLESICTQDKELMSSIERNRIAYVNKKLGSMHVVQLGQTVVAMVYAEEYVNEVAHAAINHYVLTGYPKVAVLVGVHTKGDDMFHVRTHGVSAKDIAWALNQGKGKDTTAVVFLGNSKEPTFKVVQQVLSSNPNCLL